MKENEFYLIQEKNITKALFDRGKEIGELANPIQKRENPENPTLLARAV